MRFRAVIAAAFACLPAAAYGADLNALMAPVDRRDGPGCAVGVMKDGRLAEARGYGLADIEAGRPITASTPFNIASMSKQFTGAAVAMLVAEGKLTLADDVRRYLPELPDYGPTIRIEHLLHHTSGLRNHMALAAFHSSDNLPSHEQALALVYRQSALNFAPGTRHQYESPNYVLLAEIVARVSGTPFDRFLETRIFEPLGMRHTGFAEPALARAYAPAADGGFTLNEKVNRARGSSGLLSTVEDLAKWLANFDGGKVGGGDLLARMTGGTRLADGTPVSYGYGLQVDRDHAGIPGLVMIGHGGQTAAYRSTFSYFPDRGFGTILLCNVANAPLLAAATIADEWIKASFPAPAKAAAPPADVPLPADAARLAGTYHDPVGDQLTTIAFDDKSVGLVFAGQIYPLSHRGGGRFALGDYGELRFEPQPDGGMKMTEAFEGQARIVSLTLPPAPQQPLAPFAGRYRSAEVDGEVLVELRGDKLALKYASGEGLLAPVSRDRFAAPEADLQHVAFTRDAAGAVDGLTLTTMSGISRMRFERL
jgi:CubicO group peptidase (beta-lactamase class C family)